MHNPLYLFVGRSASGKTTIANVLEEQYSLRQVQSYTTRAPRYQGEIGHVFVTEEEFGHLTHIVSYTEYNGNKYCATSELLDQCDIFVVDPPGVETLLEKYNTDRPIVALYFDANVHNRIGRMINRGDSDMQIVSRLYVDEEYDWEQVLKKTVWNYKNNFNKDVELYTVNANMDLYNVLDQAKSYMNITEDKE